MTSHVHVGRLLPGIDDDTPWYVGVHTERYDGGGWSPLSRHATRAEALEAAVPLTGALLPHWEPFPAHVPDTLTVRHPSVYDRDRAVALYATHRPVTTDMALPDQSGPETAPERSCDDLEASRAS